MFDIQKFTQECKGCIAHSSSEEFCLYSCEPISPTLMRRCHNIKETIGEIYGNNR